MGRSAASAGPRTVLVLDNGGGTIKLGFAGQGAPARSPTGAESGTDRADRQERGGPGAGCSPTLWPASRASARRFGALSWRGCRTCPASRCSTPRTGWRPASALGAGPWTPLLGAAACTAAHACRGFVVNWDLQRQIWEHALKALLAASDLRSAVLLVTEPVFNFPACREGCQQVGLQPLRWQAGTGHTAPAVAPSSWLPRTGGPILGRRLHLTRLCPQAAFEDLGVKALAVFTAPELALRWWACQHPAAPASQAGAGLVVDAGFSFIHVVPFLDGHVRRPPQPSPARLRAPGQRRSQQVTCTSRPCRSADPAGAHPQRCGSHSQWPRCAGAGPQPMVDAVPARL